MDQNWWKLWGLGINWLEKLRIQKPQKWWLNGGFYRGAVTKKHESLTKHSWDLTWFDQWNRELTWPTKIWDLTDLTDLTNKRVGFSSWQNIVIMCGLTNRNSGGTKNIQIRQLGMSGWVKSEKFWVKILYPFNDGSGSGKSSADDCPTFPK